MIDVKTLPDDHPLKPLETRMLEMAADMGPLAVQGGNFVAALRVFALAHPGLIDETATCDVCGFVGTDGYLSEEVDTVSLYLEDMGERLVWRCWRCAA